MYRRNQLNVWLLSNMYSHVNHWAHDVAFKPNDTKWDEEQTESNATVQIVSCMSVTQTSSHYVVTFASDKHRTSPYFSGGPFCYGEAFIREKNSKVIFPHFEKKKKTIRPFTTIIRKNGQYKLISEILNLFAKLKFACFNTEIQFVR